MAAPDLAHKQTDKKLLQMERKLKKIYEEARYGALKDWQEYVRISDKRINDLEEMRKKAHKAGDTRAERKINKTLRDEKERRTVLDERYKRLTRQIAKDLASINKKAIAYINKQLPEVYVINYNAFEDVAASVPAYSFELVNPTVVRNLAATNKRLLPYKEFNAVKDVKWNVRAINSQVLQGILTGESMDEIAKRLDKLPNMNREAAIRTARTAVTSAENKGRYDSYKQAAKDGLILEKQWLATNDRNTRPYHVELNGQIQPYNKPFVNALGTIMYPGDPSADGANVYNCRCTMIAKVVGLKKKKG